jgi:hypothetical protein
MVHVAPGPFLQMSPRLGMGQPNEIETKSGFWRKPIDRKH